MSRLANWQLFAICVLVWGTTWYAITWQIADVAPEFAVALRFALAGTVVLAFAARRGVPLRFTPRDHARLALQGAFMYGLSYVCVYHAERHVVSGLVAVGYSASPLVVSLGAAAAFGAALSARFLLGGLVGLAGVTLIFWPEIAGPSPGARSALGTAFTVAAVLLSAVGSLSASRNRHHGLPFWPALGYGMVYGALAALLASLALGRELRLPTDAAWWLSLLYLAIAGSVLTFACYLTLQDRLGPGPAGTIGVMTPLLALLVSLAFEGYRPQWPTLLGAALAIAGNVAMLSRGAAARG
ncbi:DMT family transporter [uncultured Piscinibacter sp.]|uniref:DMT family transporter n=1 Tax=uncultured Piscinibacter sp. TaxID=1131835 RepID=UPI002632F533|nr:DMT family transporter [uncultured Piscinibacter sp.]